MGRSLLALAMVFLLAVTLFAVPASAAEKVNIFMDNTTVTYTPEGYYPSAKADGFVNELKYEVTDTATGAAVSIPVKGVGSYTVRAYMDETPQHSAASCTASLVIEKAAVYFSVKNTVVAHTAMPNPVKYTVFPAWAAEMVEVSVSYRAISGYTDEGTVVDVPKDPGKYLVHIKPELTGPNVSCAGKYLVYEVAEKAGVPLSDEDALRNVPSDFTATVENINVTYSDSYSPPNYRVNVAGVETRLMYSHLYANGTIGAYTETLPTEPGDYIASCFVLDTAIGSGKLIIDKLTPTITMADQSFTYTKEGFYPPAATISPAGIDVVYKAYQYTNGTVGDSVAFPLTECGTYLVSASPADTSRYGFVVSYCYITIAQAVPTISAATSVFKEDGTPKPLELAVSPSYADYTVSYYRLKDGTAIPLDGAPSLVGEYYATVAVKGTSNISSVTQVYGIRIISSVSVAERLAAVCLKVICLGLCVGATLMGCLDIFKRYKKRGA